MAIKEDSPGRLLPCYRPSNQVVIDWKGDVVLCCNDFYANHTFGNVSNKPLLESWNHPTLDSMRSTLSRKGGRQSFDFCKECDV